MLAYKMIAFTLLSLSVLVIKCSCLHIQQEEEIGWVCSLVQIVLTYIARPGLGPSTVQESMKGQRKEKQSYMRAYV